MIEIMQDEVLKQFNINASSIERITPGSYSEVFLLNDSSETKYLLKKYNRINNFDVSNLESSLQTQNYIAQSGLAPCASKTNDGKYVLEINDSAYVLMEFIEGRTYRRKRDVSDSDWHDLAISMANIHHSLKDYEAAELPEVKSSFEVDDMGVNDEFKNEISKQLGIIEELSDQVGQLAKQPVHSDPSIDNWIFSQNGPVLIDWDTAKKATVEQDLLFFDDKRLSRFLDTYLSNNDHNIDSAALKYYMLTHQLNLLQTRLSQYEAGNISEKDITKYFLYLIEVEKKIAKFKFKN